MKQDPLDRLPQIPQDWANHVVYGGALGIAAQFAGLGAWGAAGAVLTVAALKKAWDWHYEGESIAVCVGKAIATVAWPASMLVSIPSLF
jgi:hypothetical protein